MPTSLQALRTMVGKPLPFGLDFLQVNLILIQINLQGKSNINLILIQSPHSHPLTLIVQMQAQQQVCFFLMRNSILNINLILNHLPRIVHLAAIKLCHLFNKSLFIAGYMLSSWHECLSLSSTGRSCVTLSQYRNVSIRH